MKIINLALPFILFVTVVSAQQPITAVIVSPSADEYTVRAPQRGEKRWAVILHRDIAEKWRAGTLTESERQGVRNALDLAFGIVGPHRPCVAAQIKRHREQHPEFDTIEAFVRRPAAAGCKEK